MTDLVSSHQISLLTCVIACSVHVLNHRPAAQEQCAVKPENGDQDSGVDL